MDNVKKTNIDKIRGLASIFRSFRKQFIVLLILVQLTSLLESVSLALFFPLFKVMATPEAKGEGVFLYLEPVFRILPEKYLLAYLGGAIVLLILIKNIFIMYRMKYAFKLVFNVRQYWMTRMMDKFMHSPYSRIISSKQGELLNNLLTEPIRASKSLDLAITFISTAFVALYLYLILLFVNWQITFGITVFMAVLLYLSARYFSAYSLRVGKEQIKLKQGMTVTAAENLAAIRQVKIFSMEEETSSSFDKILTRLHSLLVRFLVLKSLPVPVFEVIIATVLIAVLLYMVYIAKMDMVSTIPILGLFAIVGQKLFKSVSNLVSNWMVVLSALPSLKLVHESASAEGDEEDLDKGESFDALGEDIVFKDICFSYEKGSKLYDKLNMVIPVGKVTALVGPSGSGKSTIVDLLMGFALPQEGSIVVNSRDLSELSLSSWRKKVGYVSQDTFIFNTSIEDNILVGKPGASHEEVVNAARQANADVFIQQLPDGYKTVTGDRGAKLSGGQRQRIAIARAIIRDPEFFIFDEATSSLDSESERLIQKSIESLGIKKTVLVITHRLSTIMNADLVYRIEEGSITAKGPVSDVLGDVNEFLQIKKIQQ